MRSTPVGMRRRIAVAAAAAALAGGGALAAAHRAITVLEELTDGPRLFPREFSKAAKPRAYMGDAMSAITANAGIARFAAWADSLAAEHGREHERIPADPDGAVTMRRFRRILSA